MTDSAPQEIVGVIGLGAMGAPMARHLLGATDGRAPVLVTTRRPRPDLADAGFTWCATPRALAETADLLLAMLPDLAQLEEVLEGPDGVLAGLGDDRELLLMIGSTSSPVAIRALAADLGARTQGRVRVVDCPVSGGEDGAIAGTLSIMLGGDDADVARAARVLAACGRPVHLGPLGAGEVAKACNQLIVASTIVALGEASVLAERSGLDLAVLLDLLAGGYAGSNLLESRRRRLVDADYSPSGMARYMVKDLRFAADVAEATDTHPVLLPALQQAFDEIVAAGLGDQDITVARLLLQTR